MSPPASRQEWIAGSVEDECPPSSAREGAGRLRHSAVDARATLATNPFASFYESRRRLTRAATGATDPSSSITRAYTIPDSLLALARGASDADLDRVRGPRGGESPPRATFSGRSATGSLGLPAISALDIGRGSQWRALRCTASRVATWLRGRRGQLTPD